MLLQGTSKTLETNEKITSKEMETRKNQIKILELKNAIIKIKTQLDSQNGKIRGMDQ